MKSPAIIFRTRKCAWSVVFLCAACAGLARAEETGTLTYPSEDNVCLKEGTLEFWWMTPLDVRQFLPSTRDYHGLFSLVRLEGELGGLSMGYFAGASYQPGAGLFCSTHSRKIELHGMFLKKFIAEPGRWYHFALTWNGKQFRFYLDGKLRTEKTCLEFIHIAFGTFSHFPIFFGDKWHRRSKFVLDEVRLSSVERTPDELGCHGKLEIDPFTRVLDSFEVPFTPDGKRRTRPDWIYAGEGGLPSKFCRFSPGKYGLGLALFRK